MSTIQEYKCPCCGGAIAFDSSIQKMKCPYCDTEFEMETLQAYDDDLKTEAPDEMEWEIDTSSDWTEEEADGMRVYICNSCGGEIVGDASMAASSCPFCGNPVVIMGQFAGVLRPDLVIPFKLDKNAAKEALERHVSGKKLLPKVFRDQNHIDEIKGIYVPFWLFDADANANLRYKATRRRLWSDAHYNYIETSYFSVIRNGTLRFEGVPVDGSSKISNELMESIEPFDLSAAVDFQTAYLAGYFADKYDVSSEESIERANARVKTSTESAFAQTVMGFDTVIPEASSVRLNDGRARYALYPVWLLNTTWNGQRYTFAMNGQTGKFVGDLPMDKSVYNKYLFGITAVGTALVTLFSYLFWAM